MWPDGHSMQHSVVQIEALCPGSTSRVDKPICGITCQVGPQEVQLLLSKQGIQALHNVYACSNAEDADSCNEGPYEFVSVVPIGVQGSGRLVGLHDARPQKSLHSGCDNNTASDGHAPAPSRLGRQMQPGWVK